MFDDPVVQADMKHWPFEVVQENGKPKIRVEFIGQRRTFHPEEVSAMVLGKMKATAEAYLGADVRRAVITVPAYFTDSQRQATKDAGAIAGLDVLRIINEPTAGALAYGLDKDNDTDGEERNVLIFDLGGGTFDVSVLTIEEGIFEVRATAGDTHFGGEDFDSRLMEHFAQEFQRKYGLNMRSDKKALRRLRTACERAKRTLSAASEATIEIDMLHSGKDLVTKITRSRFNDLCDDLFSATLPPVRQALRDAELSVSDIHDVVLVGGSTRIPTVQSLLREFFQGKELNMTVNPDEAVAYGAAVQAAALDGDNSALVTDLVLIDITPLSLGINVVDAKRLIGRKFDDPVVQADIKQWPFEVVQEDGKTKIKVEFKGELKTFYPEEVSSIVLSKMKATAKAYLSADVRRAVITVPAYFTDSQRQATKDAGAIAGLDVLRIINEPTAGALAYGLDKDNENDGEERNVLIFDLGGGTFDVSVLTIEEGIFEVRATAGDTHLGGEDFDNRLVEHFVQEFERKHSVDMRNDKKALRRLRTACERAKRTLSAASEANIEIDMLHDGKDLRMNISRSRFEDLCCDLFTATLPPVRQALRDAELLVGDIHDVVLIGGSTRIPKVQCLLRDFFQGKELNMTVNPDEAVAYGAAVQAAMLDGDNSSLVTGLVLVDVTPLSLGITIAGEITSIIIKRNTKIPIKKTQQYHTCFDNQTAATIEVVEGERQMSADNNLLGQFNIVGFPRMPAGKSHCDVTFEIDTNGILHVSAVETSSGATNEITIVRDSSRLSDEDIERLLHEAERFRQEDETRKATAEARNKLQRYCYETKNRVRSMRLSFQDREMVLGECDATLRWLETTSRATTVEYETKRHELDLAFRLIINL